MTTIKCFGFLATVISPEMLVSLPDKINKKIILSLLTEKYPTYQAELEKCNVAVNQVYIYDEEVYSAGITEIALIPPVSGG